MSGVRKRPARFRFTARLDRAYPIPGILTIYPGGLAEVRPAGCRRKWDVDLSEMVQRAVERKIHDKVIAEKKAKKDATKAKREERERERRLLSTLRGRRKDDE